MKKVLVVLILLVSIAKGFSQLDEEKVDTIFVSQEELALSKDDLILKYGAEDTSRAIINMFYRERKWAQTELYIVPIALFATGYTVMYEDIKRESWESNMNTRLIQIVGVTTGILATLTCIDSASKKDIFTQKFLIQLLKSRQRGEYLPYEIWEMFKKKDFK